jgi:uncharacterized oligopeptide transporter (OPT) family protein
LFPRRRQVIIKERLKFPSGFSTAVLIGVLHGRTATVKTSGRRISIAGAFASLAGSEPLDASPGPSGEGDGQSREWKKSVLLLFVCFLISGIFTFLTYFFPILRNLPIFGHVAASAWLWTLNPSLAYVGQGIIMGPATTLHMLLGTVVGWGILSPLAKFRGWAPGDVDDWENGSKGWIVWVSLAIMLADAVVSLGYLAFRPALQYVPLPENLLASRFVPEDLKVLLKRRAHVYAPVGGHGDGDGEAEDATPRPSSVDAHEHMASFDRSHDPEKPEDAPPDQLISNRTVGVGLVLSILFCILCIHAVFGSMVPLYATVAAVLMALVLSIMGVRALGETDLNPVSGISKLAQLFFALIIPQSNKSSVLINLVAGAVVSVLLLCCAVARGVTCC